MGGPYCSVLGSFIFMYHTLHERTLFRRVCGTLWRRSHENVNDRGTEFGFTLFTW